MEGVSVSICFSGTVAASFCLHALSAISESAVSWLPLQMAAVAVLSHPLPQQCFLTIVPPNSCPGVFRIASASRWLPSLAATKLAKEAANAAKKAALGGSPEDQG